MDIPERLLPVVGAARKDTRIHTAKGGGKEYRAWVDVVMGELGPGLIPMTWVADYVGVSRMAVHRRMEQGYLTVVTFEIDRPIITLRGLKKRAETESHSFASLADCKVWVTELVERTQHRQRRHANNKMTKLRDFLTDALAEFIEATFAYDPKGDYEDNHH